MVALLVGFPFIGALSMRLWLGVPKEAYPPAELFRQLQVRPVAVSESNALQFGQMFFCKLQLNTQDVPGFVASLNEFERSTGRPVRPISFKLERGWWDVDLSAEGVCWKKPGVTIWSPLDRPEVFYGVVSSGE